MGIIDQYPRISTLFFTHNLKLLVDKNTIELDRFRHFVALSLAYACQRNATQEHHQMLIGDGRLPFIHPVVKGLITSPLQSFGIDHKTITIPHQELNRLATFAKEDIDRSAQWIRPQLITHQAAEPVETLAHICASPVDVKLLMRTKS